MRKPIIAGNWKMHTTHLEAISLVQKLHHLLRPQDYDAVDVVVCPPFTALRPVQILIESDRIPIGLGAQNCHFEDKGAFTGEVSAPMLARLKCSHVIVGHSERRKHFSESDDVVNRKAKTVLAHSMTPIVCVGETLGEREAGSTERIVTTQVRGSVAGLTPEQLGALVVAYEPVWAIGTGRTAQPSDANEVIRMIRNTVGAMGGSAAAERVRIQYGGSVTAGNIRDIMAQPEIDGALVGGASIFTERDKKKDLDPEEFALIIRYKS